MVSNNLFYCRFLFISFAILMACNLSLTPDMLWAAITNPTCAITTPTDLTKHYNNGQMVTLSATWQGDTPPFAATFKAGGIPIGTVNTNGNTANFIISASGLSGESVNFAVSIIETAVAGAQPSPDAPAAGTLLLDRTPPKLELKVTSGSIVSPQNGFNTVTLSFTSDEPLAGPPVFTITPGNWSSPTPSSPEAPPYSSNQYTITVPNGTPGGVYTVRVQGFDDTEPAASRNSSTAQTSFQVDASADGAPAILSCSPKSPFRTESLTLSGSVPIETSAQKVEILEGGTVLATATVPANTDTWSVTISNISEGNHSYTARRIDPLGNVSPSSAEFPVVADRTPPHEPILEPIKKPVNSKKVTVRGNAVTDPPHNSTPLKVTLYCGSTPIASTTANADGSFTFTDVEMPSTGQNQLVARAADTTWDGSGSSKGNESGYSNLITVTVDMEAPYIVNGGISISRPSSGSQFMRDSATGSCSTGLNGVTAPPTLEISTNLSTDQQSAFLPPPSGWSAGLVPVSLPLSLVRDRSPSKVRVWVAFRKLGQPRSLMYLVPMTLGGNYFNGFLPNDPLPLFYRFRLLDAAGNESFFPPNGEFFRGVQPADTLRLVHQPSWYESAPSSDEWPVDIIGLPPLSRILKYRRVMVSDDMLETIKTWLTAYPEAAAVEVTALSDAADYDADSHTSWRRDLELLNEGNLPPERLEILIPEVINGDIPLRELPKPDSVPDGPEWQKLRDAIRFRLLHDLPR